jgi:hypothetical protein
MVAHFAFGIGLYISGVTRQMLLIVVTGRVDLEGLTCRSSVRNGTTLLLQACAHALSLRLFPQHEDVAVPPRYKSARANPSFTIVARAASVVFNTTALRGRPAPLGLATRAPSLKNRPSLNGICGHPVTVEAADLRLDHCPCFRSTARHLRVNLRCCC